MPRPASRPCRRPRATCALATRVPAGGDIPTNITRGSPHSGHGGARPRTPFNSVKPNIYEYKRTKCGRIDLVRAHIIRYRTHIQHTRANKYSYPSAVVPAPSQLLRRGTTVSRTPLVAASDSHTRCSHTHVPRPASRPCRRPRATCALATRVPTGGEISTNITRGSPHPGHGGARPRAPFTSVMPNIYEYKRTKCDRIDLVRAHLFRYRTHIQNTRANTYSYPSAVVPAPSTPPPRHYCLPHAVGRGF